MADTPLTSEVPVINPSGEFVYIPADRLQEAVKMGYSPMTPQDVKAKELEEEYSGPKGAALATLAGAARGLSIGASDLALTKTGLVEPETLKALKEAQPALSTIADVGGSLIGAGKLKALGVLPKAVAGAGRAAQALVPAAAEGAGLASQVLRGAGRTALGSSVEGAIYGAGQAVSESALEDKELTAEALASGIGFGAALGGGFGAVLGAGGTVLQKLLGKAGSEAVEAAVVKGESLDDIVTETGLRANIPKIGVETSRTSGASILDTLPVGTPQATREAVETGLLQKKANIKEVEEAAEYLGAKTTPGMLTDNPEIMRRDRALLEHPSIAGTIRRNIVTDAFNKIKGAIDSFTGDASELSAYQLGEKVREGFKSKLQPYFDRNKELFDVIEPYRKAIKVPKNRLQSNFMKMFNEEKIAVRGAEADFIKNMAEQAKYVQDLDGLMNLQSTISRAARAEQNASLRRTAAQLNQRVDNLIDRSIEDAAKSMKSDEAKERILGLVKARKQARADYAENVVKKAAPVLKEIQGPGASFEGPVTFLETLDDIKSEDLGKWITDRNNVAFQKYLEKEVPEVWGLIRSSEIQKLKSKAISDGRFSVGKFIKSVSELQPEYRHALFGKERDEFFKHAKVYIDALPPNYNPSGTASMSLFLRAIESPYGTVAAETSGIFNALATSSSSKDGMIFKTIKALEQKQKSVVNQIRSDSNAIFTVLPRAGTTAVLKAPGASDKKSEEERKKEYEKAKEEVKKITTGGQASFDNAENAASSLYAIAPEVTSTLQMTAMKGASFLASKLQESPDHPLDGKMPESPAQINKFLQYYSAVKDPVGVLARVKDGTITGADLETLNYVYPRLYATMKTQVQEALVNYTGKKDKKKLPYRTQMALSAFLGMDLSPSLSPQAVADYQMTHAMPNRASDSQVINPTQGGMSQITASNRAETPTQAVASGRNNA